MNISWDAEKYTKDFSFVHEYGSGVMELIVFAAAETAVDLGCGNGALTAVLKEKGLRVTGIDASEELLAIAKRRYPDIRFIKMDATELRLEEPVDVVFSNAVFHWIDRRKQRKMLSHIADALKQNGQLVFEFGGRGNNAAIHGALENAFAAEGCPYRMDFYFPDAEEYTLLLEQAGFRVETAMLFERPTPLKGENGLRDWIEMFEGGSFSDVPAAVKERIIGRAISETRGSLYRDGIWYADYVRLRMKAVKR